MQNVLQLIDSAIYTKISKKIPSVCFCSIVCHSQFSDSYGINNYFVAVA